MFYSFIFAKTNHNKMEEKFGLIKGMKCQLSKTDPSLIEALSVKTGISAEKVKEMMLYNMFTVGQFSKLTLLSISTVHNKTRLVLEDGVYTSELDFTYPFSEPDNLGPKFIVRNAKSEAVLKA
jgi:hypothetical protein